MTLDDLGRAMRTLREGQGLSREALAEKADVHPQTLLGIEHNSRRGPGLPGHKRWGPRMGIVLNILGAMGYTLEVRNNTHLMACKRKMDALKLPEGE